jgi:response regulator RpfG family c-di-GMP phosphodiesterase
MELPKVLYVDDEEINLELFQLTFLNELQVFTAQSASEGLQILKEHPEIKLVISDLKMSGMNGLEFIKEVKGRDPDKVCMLLTGFMESEVMMEAFNKELIFRYMMKPWKKNELLENIQTVL